MQIIIINRQQTRYRTRSIISIHSLNNAIDVRQIKIINLNKKSIWMSGVKWQISIIPPSPPKHTEHKIIHTFYHNFVFSFGFIHLSLAIEFKHILWSCLKLLRSLILKHRKRREEKKTHNTFMTRDKNSNKSM